MPYISLTTSVKLDDQLKQLITNQIVQITHTILRKDIGLTVVNVKDSFGDWFTFSPGTNSSKFRINICITEGTNTPEEIEDWLFQTNKAISSSLKADDSQANYLSVTEFPASSWGYNGLSQQARNNKK